MEARPDSLTETQQEACWLLLDGLTIKAIAERLGLTESAVKLRLRRAYRKKGVRTGKEFMRKFSHLIVNNPQKTRHTTYKEVVNGRGTREV